MDKKTIQELGDSLFQHFEAGTGRAALTDTHPDMTVEVAYHVQEVIVGHHLKAGRRIVGRKIGLTSKALQKQVGIDQPDFGVLFDSHVFENRARFSMKERRMVYPRMEAELGFILSRDLMGPDLTAATVMAATHAIFPAFEIVDSRVKDWKIKLADTIADNSSSWGIVIGDRLVDPRGLDLTTVGMVLEKDGEVLLTGAGAAVYDHPARAVAWLGNKLSEFGVPLKAGEYILSGSFTSVLDASPGTYRARFGDGLGSVELTLTE